MKLTMEKQIERLIELGKEYKKVGMEYGFGNNNRTYVINGYNPIMPKDGAAKVSLYFADNYETYAFQVGGFEWSEYSDKVEIKVSALRDLNELFFYAQSILQILKSEFGDAIRKIVEAEKAERINTLKSELKALEDES